MLLLKIFSKHFFRHLVTAVLVFLLYSHTLISGDLQSHAYKLQPFSSFNYNIIIQIYIYIYLLMSTFLQDVRESTVDLLEDSSVQITC